MSRALGDHFVKESDLGVTGKPFICEPVKLTPEDNLLIVASDGVCCCCWLWWWCFVVVVVKWFNCGDYFFPSNFSSFFQLWDVISGQEAIDMCRTERTARGNLFF